MRLRAPSLGLLCLLAMLLLACGPAAALKKEFTAISTPLAPGTDPFSRPTPPPPSATVESIAVRCDKLPPAEGDGVPLPDLTQLDWASLPGADQPARYLAGLGYFITDIHPSPDGRWLVVSLESSPASQAIAVVDTEGTDHWWANTNGSIYNEQPYAWLPDGRLLWVDEGGSLQLWDRNEQRNLQAPQPVDAVWYARGTTAFARGLELQLWRVDVETGTWEEVAEGEPIGGYFSVAHDGEYGVALQGKELWSIPAKMGGTAQLVGELNLEPIARSGAVRPGVQLADSAYWVLGLPVQEQGISSDEPASAIDGFVVNTRTGEPVLAQAFPVPDRYRISAYRASPDGKWLAASLVDGQEQTAVYIAPAADLFAGTLVEGVDVAGWHVGAPAAILREQASGTLSAAPLPPTTGKSGTVLNGAGIYLTTLPEAVFALDAETSTRLLQFDLAGNELETLDLGAQFETIREGTKMAGRLIVAVTGGERLGGLPCTSALVDWKVAP